MTRVDPTAKALPGLWLLSVRVTDPELSTAVGSVHTTVVDGVPNSISLKMLFGQPVIVGFSLSTETPKKD